MKRQYYKLTPSQETMYYLVLFTMHTQAASIPFYFKLDKELDIETLRRAAEIEFERNDSLRLRFCGNLFKPKQYFTDAPEFEGKIRTKDFYGRPEEEEEFFKKESLRPFKYRRGETVRIVLTKTAEGKTGIYIDSFHLITDAYGVLTTVNDILAVYESLANGTELPPPLDRFEEKIVSEIELADSEQMKREREAAKAVLSECSEPFYAAPWGIGKLLEQRKKKKNERLRTYPIVNALGAQSGLYSELLNKETSARILSYCEENKVALSAVLSLGYRTYCSAVNKRSEYVALANLFARRKNKKDKNMSGCLTLTSITGREISEDETFASSAEKLSLDMMRSMRYSDLSYGDQIAEMPHKEDFSMIHGLPSLFLSFINHTGVFAGGNKYTVRGYSTGYFGLVLYVLAVHNIDEGTIDCEYMHQLSYLPEWNVRELHENALRVIEAGIDNPGITIGELLDMVESKHINKHINK